MINSFRDIIAAAKNCGVKRAIIPDPTPADISLLGNAVKAGLIRPILVGDDKTIMPMIAGTALASEKYELWKEKEPQQSLTRTLEAVRSGDGDILMQGGSAPPEFLAAVQDKENGLGCKGMFVSYLSLFELLKREKLIFVTDTIINNFPTLIEKQQILANALQLARLLGIEDPKVAVLAAIEQVNPGIPSTLDAAILSKMGERRQFGKAVVEGPLDIDCALSQVAAGRKGLKSVVTGNVDVYLVPEIDTGHLLAEALVFFGRMQTAGLLMGTSRPAIMNLPFVAPENRLVEIALASLACGKGGSNG